MLVEYYYNDLKESKRLDKIIVFKKISCIDIEEAKYLDMIKNIYKYAKTHFIYRNVLPEQEEWHGSCISRVIKSIRLLKNYFEPVRNGGNSYPKCSKISDNKVPFLSMKDKCGIRIYTVFNYITIPNHLNSFNDTCFDPSKSCVVNFPNTFRYLSKRFFKKFQSANDAVVRNIKVLMKTLHDECNENPDNIYSYCNFMEDIDRRACTTLNIARILVSLDQIISNIETLENAYKLERFMGQIRI